MLLFFKRRAVVAFAGTLILPFFALANGDDVHPEDARTPGEVASTVTEEISVQDGFVVNMNLSHMPVFVGTPVRLDFLVNERPNNIPVPFYDLDVIHTKLMHIIGVRSDLNEFRHVHPEPSTDNPALFSIEHTFTNPGEYKFWSEASWAGREYSFSHPLITIVGTGTPARKDISLARNVITDNYQVALTVPQRIAKGRAIDLTLEVHTLVGDGVALGEYLGEEMHLVAIKDDLTEFIHAHPMEAHTETFNTITPRAHAHGPTGDAPGYEPMNFHITFPAPGLYKLFAEFSPEGSNLTPDDTLTAAFWVEVGKSTLTPAVGRAILATVSLILMSLLSVGVYRYMYRAPKGLTS